MKIYLAKSVLITLRLTTAASTADVGIQKKISGLRQQHSYFQRIKCKI